MENVVQYIILRADPKTKHDGKPARGKIAAMASHASIAFLSERLMAGNASLNDDEREWFGGIFTKIILKATKEEMETLMESARTLGFTTKKDFVPIEDNCLTEFLPDEGSDRCLAAIGFRPMRRERIKSLVGHLSLFK